MIEIVQAGGWLMLPIIACSIAAMTIIAERLWAYRQKKVIPSNLVAQIWQLHQKGQITAAHIGARQYLFFDQAHRRIFVFDESVQPNLLRPIGEMDSEFVESFDPTS